MSKIFILGFVLLGVLALTSSSAFSRDNLVAHLSGDEEVPTVDTKAQGQAIFKVQGNSLSLDQKLILANINNVVAAHIHCAPVGVNGPVGVTLFSGPPTTVNGILVQGPILAPNPGNACGWLDLNDLIEALESGDTYVNVHTLDHLAGEIRGQVR